MIMAVLVNSAFVVLLSFRALHMQQTDKLLLTATFKTDPAKPPQKETNITMRMIEAIFWNKNIVVNESVDITNMWMCEFIALYVSIRQYHFTDNRLGPSKSKKLKIQ